MQNTEQKIRIIHDRLSSIGPGEKKLDNTAILAMYSINTVGNLCPVVPRVP
jgi:septin family protein